VSGRKSERLMNLVICLLVARTYLSRERIREAVDGYAGQSDEAFERMFERDKEELRELGVPVETGSADRYFDDELGYRIRRERFQLPPLRLAPDEAAVLGLAARVWQQAGLASATESALRKLGAAGVATDRGALSVIEPRLVASEPAFEPLFDAAVRRRPVRFAYRGSGSATTVPRSVHPWGLGLWRGRWYLVGWDVDRANRRTYRLGRIAGPVTVTGDGPVAAPPAGSVRAALETLDPLSSPSGTARVRVRAGSGLGLRHRASSATTDGAAGPGTNGWDVLELPYSSPGSLADDVAGYGADAVVLSPPEARAAVVARLTASARAESAGPADAGGRA